MRAIGHVALTAVIAFVGLASAAEPSRQSGIYVGAEIGSAKTSTWVDTWSQQYDVSGTTTGWGLFAGFRPGKYFGGEINYLDFGNVNSHNLGDSAAGVTYNASAKTDAFGLHFVGYLPVAKGWDLFGKVGYARLQTTTNSNGNYPNICVVVPAGGSCTPVGMASRSTSHDNDSFAWGIGAQYRLNSTSVRVEYQQLATTSGVNNGSPSLLSLGVAWHF